MPERPFEQKGRGSGPVLDDYVTWQSGGIPSKANRKILGGGYSLGDSERYEMVRSQTTTDYLTARRRKPLGLG